ncbi:general transcription factor II-I repeat domain-containing protein 2-like [Sebastes fasciatus]|uniref:general transcription factor II-I repeat domain-containing protein 2-like n=1 Tax=Sebastes fasciatus TaxID=394691 RepID=UPI003D9E8C8F
MAKRKVDFENRGFQGRWEAEYMFADIKGKAVCLVCGDGVAVMKEYNVRHYEAKHHDRYKHLDMKQRLQKVEELKRSLVSQQAMFTNAKSQSEAAVKASFIVATEVAKSARPFTEGEFVKNCMMKVCDVVCPDKRQAFSNVSLSRNTVADRVRELATNLQQQLVGKGKDFIAYSLAVDESSDTSDTAQLSIFIRGVDSSLCVTEELLGLRSMHGTTTGKDLFEEVSRCVNEMGLPWDKLVGLTTDGAPAMCGQKNGLVGRVREKMREENGAGELTAYHCIIHQESLCGKALKMEHVMSTITRAVNFIRARGLNHRQFKSFLEELGSEYGDLPYHTEVRWLSQGKVLKRCFELHEEICQFMESKGRDTTELRDKKLRCEVAFLCDITSHLNALNLQLQGRGHVITEMYATVRAFKTKLRLWETQMLQENFEAQKSRFELLSNPFAADVESAPTNLQMELIELQCSDTLKAKYDSVGAAQFPRFIPDTMPQLQSEVTSSQREENETSDVCLSDASLQQSDNLSTSDVESFQNHVLMYAAKRFAFSPPVYGARTLLAALDYNHVNQKDEVAKCSTPGHLVEQCSTPGQSYWRGERDNSTGNTYSHNNYSYIPQLHRNILVKSLNAARGGTPKTEKSEARRPTVFFLELNWPRPKSAEDRYVKHLHIRKAYRCILAHFEEVVLSEELLQLSVQELTDILDRDDHIVRKEITVYEAILRWIAHVPDEHKGHIAVLLSKVQ